MVINKEIIKPKSAVLIRPPQHTFGICSTAIKEVEFWDLFRGG
jgi:hypothetical protein